MKKILKNRVFQILIAFVVGGFVAMLFAPEKIKIEEKEVVKWKTKIEEKEVVKWKEKEVIKEVEIVKKEKTVKIKETFPDGHIVETEIYESESEQIARVQEMEKEKYAQLLKQKEEEFDKQYSYLKEHTNPKKLNVYAGMGVTFDKFSKHYVGGFNYPIWGPFIFNLEGTSQPGVNVAFGLRF